MSDPAAPLLALRGIGKRFPGVVALDGVDFTLRAGEIHALLGENGAGKSTLIKVLTGVHPPDAGTIELAGRPVRPDSPHAAERAGISTVYQEVNLVPTLSVAENIMLGRQPRRLGLIRWGEVRRRAQAALARVGLECDVDAELGSLSVALQQMVAIARALDVSARVLVLDEPTASLDAAEVAELFRVMRRLRDDGLGIVFVTHFLEQVYAVTDRITVLRNGRLVGSQPTAELPRLALVSLMLGREIKLEEHAPAPRADREHPAVYEATGLGRRGSVQGVDLRLRRGEVTGLAGLLGSGRTETARLVFGLDRPDAGTARLAGGGTHRLTPRDAVQRGVGFCSEDRKREGILPNLSVRENLIVALQAKRGAWRPVTEREQRELCERFVAALRIKVADVEVPINTLSGGNQQKVLLARWLATQPVLLILDEPTRGIDVGAKQEIEQLIAKLSADGLAVLFISSEVEEIVRNCHRVLVLRERRPAGEFASGEVELSRLMRAMAEPAGEGKP
ncbi:MAG TPA: sugar ABC transporter ATP-binding protein [Opitutaceae bacterium]|nr:sugar ABC transporter ATP-binding protein [Opitutaceae bacterium]